jgi:polysaccharide export outer membrane protein
LPCNEEISYINFSVLEAYNYKMFYVLRYFSCFISIFILALLGCSPKTALVKNETQLEPEHIPPVEISEYILGYGDELEVSLFRHDEMTRKVKILQDGKIHYLLVGEIRTQGLSINQLRDKLREGLTKYFIDPQVSVIVTSTGSQKILVLGEVNRPGVYQLEGPKSVVEAVSEAGGFTLDGKPSHLLLIRGGLSNPNPSYKVLDIEKALNQVDMTQNIALQKGDIIYVPATEYADAERFFKRLWTIIPLRFGFVTRVLENW